MKAVLLDNEDLKPKTVTLEKGEVLEFENHSVHPMVITFIEPADLTEKVRCGLVRHAGEHAKEGVGAQAPWQLFTWRDKQLIATIPPGRFASLCSLAPGTYTYTVSPQSVAVRAPGTGGTLPEKGEIIVK
jgi:hypothetical protein